MLLSIFQFAPGDDVKDVIDDAVEALEARVDNVTDIYELGISGYALQLAGSNKVEDVLAKLDETAKEEGVFVRSFEMVYFTPILKIREPEKGGLMRLCDSRYQARHHIIRDP